LVIELEEASFSYRGPPVLDNLRLKLEAGSFGMLVGAAGAGKSTLLRLCHLDLEPSAGRVRFFGRPIAATDRDGVAELRRRVGLVPQDCPFLDHLGLIDNIALPLRAAGIAAAARADDVRALLEWVGLSDRQDARPFEVTRPERRRAALARAVILSPEVILVDEPGPGAERAEALQLLALLVELNRMGKTVLAATRDLELAREIEGRVPFRLHHLDGGRLCARAEAPA
jgi:cell division transport system ATP-binding protein